MSKQVDSRVVEMQFDNRHFENNVKTTMSTLDKLKQSLQFKDAEKGFDNLNSSAKKVDMTHLGKGLETCRAKFSALEVMGVTALANITNSAVNAGKRLVKAFTIDPVKSGFNEYELKMGAIQTIMASTGESLDTVNKKLNELNTYSDQTIYSFQDMTQNIGKFTNAGVKLDDAVAAIKGVSNEAAVSGANANEASRAMYNFAQALSAGYVKLIDWKSIENANMATVEFKNQLIETAVGLGTVEKSADGMYKTLKGNAFNATKNFNEVLQDQWMTSEVLIETLKDYADENTAIGKKAKAAATEVKTFSMMMDTLKETAQSGWAQTWELILGDFNEAKGLFTRLTDFFSGIIDASSKFRNTLLEGALGKTFTNLSEKIQGLTKPLAKSAEAISTVTETVKNYDKIVSEILGGVWGNGQERFDKLTKAGYDWAHAQNLVNEKLGDGTRHATNYNKAQAEVANTEKTSVETKGKLTKADAKRLEQLVKMSDAELKAAGYTKDQIKAFRELGTEADKLGMSVSEFVSNIDKLSGRTILLNSFKNIGQSIVTVFKSMSTAWKEIFPPATSEQLYNVIAGFHKLSTYFVIGDETANNLARTFKGLFAALDIILTITGGPLKIAFKALTKLLGAFDLNILDVTASIGDSIVGFRDWLDSVLDFGKIFEKLKPYLDGFIETISKWKNNIKAEFENVAPDIIVGLRNGIVNGAKAVWDAIVNLGKTILEKFISIFRINSPSKETEAIGESLIEGLVNGVKNGVSGILAAVGSLCSKVIDAFKGANWKDISDVLYMITTIFNKIPGLNVVFALSRYFASAGSDVAGGLFEGIKAGISKVGIVISELATKLIETFKSILGIHSPSTVFYALGGFIIAGLLGGLLATFPGIIDFFKTAGSIIAGFFKNLIEKINFGAIGDFIKNGFSKIIDFVKNIDLGKVFAIAFSVGMAITAKKTFDLLERFGDIAEAVVAPLKGLGKALGGLGTYLTNVGKAKLLDAKAKGFLRISISLAILAGALKLLSTIPWQQLLTSSGVLIALGGALLAFSKLVEKIKTESLLKIDNFGKTMLQLAGAVAIIGLVIKLLSGMSWSEFAVAAAGIGFIGVFIAGLIWATKLAGKDIALVGPFMTKLGKAMLLMAVAIRLLGGMEWSELGKAGAAIGGLGVIIAGLIFATKLAGNQIDKAGIMLSKLGAAILLLAISARLIGSMSWSELGKAGAGITGLAVIITGLIWATKLAGNQLDKVGKTILAISAAMLLLTITAKIIAGMEWSEMGKAAVGLVALGGIITGLIAATRLAGGGNLKGVATTLLAMSLCMGIMAGMAVVLSLISLPDLAKGITAVAILGVIMSAMVRATKDAGDAKSTIIAMSIAIGIMAASVAVLSFIDPTKLAGATAAMSIVMYMFAVILRESGNVKGAMGTIIAMTVAVGVIGGMLYLLAQLPIEQTVGSAIALGTLMAALAIALSYINKIKVGKNTVGALIALTAMVIPLSVFAIALDKLPDISGKTANIITLTTVMTAMTALLAVLTLVGAMATALGGGMTMAMGIIGLTAMVIPLAAFGVALALLPDVSGKAESITIMVGVMTTMTALLAVLSVIGLLAMTGAPLLGVLALTTMVVPLAVFALAINALPDVTQSIGTITILVSVMTILTNLLTVLAIIGPLALIGVTALTALIGVMTVLGTFATAIGALVTYFPQLQTFVDTGIELLVGLANGIGRMLGAFVGGIINEVASTLPGLGLNLSLFMAGALPFIMGIKMVDSAATEGVKNLAVMMLTLTGASLLESLTSWITGGSSLVDFGKELAAFAPYIVDFSNQVKNIDNESVTAAANAGKMLAEMASAIPNEGGLVSVFAGENDMETFGSKLKSFGSAIKSFSDVTTGITIDGVKPAVDAAKLIIKMADSIPNKGGLLSVFSGDNDMATFGTQLVLFGIGLKSYCVAVTGITAESVQPSIDAAKGLIKIANMIPKSGGLFSVFTADNDMSTFATEIKKFGKGLKGYSESVSEMNVEAVNSSISAAKTVVKFINSLNNLGTDGVTKFKDAVNSLAKVSIDKLVSAFNGASGKLKNIGSNMIQSMVEGLNAKKSSLSAALNNVVTSASTLVKGKTSSFKNAGSALMNALVGGVKSKAQSLNPAFTSIITAALNAIKSKADSFNTAGKTLADKLNSGIKTKKDSVKKSAESLATAGKTAIRDKYDSWKSSGKYLVDGLIAGIKAKKPDAVAEATALGNAVHAAYKKAVGEGSPAKKFIDSGMYLVMGLANGLRDYAYIATNASTNLGIGVRTAFEDYLGIHSPATVGIEDGRYFAQGIAEGITEDMSAEEAAENKARNITEAFQKEFDKFSLDNETIDLEYSLWESQNPGATEYAKAVRRAEADAAKIPFLQENVKLAEGKYFQMVKEFGEDSERAQEAGNEVIKAQTELADMLTTVSKSGITAGTARIDELKAITEITNEQYSLWEKMHTEATDAEKAQAKMQFDNMSIGRLKESITISQNNYQSAVAQFGVNSKQAQEYYSKYLSSLGELIDTENNIKESRQTVKDARAEEIIANIEAKEKYDEYLAKWAKHYEVAGMSMDDLIKNAQKITGYNPTVSLNIADANISPANTIISGGSAVINPYLHEMNIGANAIVEDASNVGLAYVSGIGEGIQNGSSQMVSTISATLSSCADTLKINQTDWISAGEQLMNGLVQGIRNGSQNMNAVIVEAIAEAYNVTSTILSGEGNVSLTIRPVVDMSGINDLFMSNELSFAGFSVEPVIDRLDSINNTLYGIRTENEARGNRIIGAINELRSEMQRTAVSIGERAGSSVGAAISGMSVKMDKGAVVGEIINDIDNTLGNIATHKGRGN